jgi:hypothetical protein
LEPTTVPPIWRHYEPRPHNGIRDDDLPPHYASRYRNLQATLSRKPNVTQLVIAPSDLRRHCPKARNYLPIGNGGNSTSAALHIPDAAPDMRGRHLACRWKFIPRIIGISI